MLRRMTRLGTRRGYPYRRDVRFFCRPPPEILIHGPYLPASVQQGIEELGIQTTVADSDLFMRLFMRGSPNLFAICFLRGLDDNMIDVFLTALYKNASQREREGSFPFIVGREKAIPPEVPVHGTIKKARQLPSLLFELLLSGLRPHYSWPPNNRQQRRGPAAF